MYLVTITGDVSTSEDVQLVEQFHRTECTVDDTFQCSCVVGYDQVVEQFHRTECTA